LAQKSSSGSGVAERYATALFELAENDRALIDLETDVGRFATMHEQSDDLRHFIQSPVFAADDQIRVMGEVLDRAEIKGLVANFIRVVAQNRRLHLLPDILAAFRRQLAKHRGEVSAEVTSAEPLSDKHLSELKEALKGTLGKDVAIEATVDPALIGGLTVKVGSRMIDGSLRTKLNSLKLAMKEVG
jgi:F-type H+-transporting ATPase subunit delta